MSFFNKISETKTETERLAEARVARDAQHNQRVAGSQRPAWASDSDSPQISLDAGYAGRLDPADIPKDGVVYRRILPGEPRDTSEATDAQREGARVQYQAEIQRLERKREGQA